MTPFSDSLRKVTKGSALTEKEMRDAISFIMDGNAEDSQIAEFLTALAERGETAAEITGAAKVLRARALAITAPENTVDCCGTGGTETGTFNISTAVALTAAACGVPVAKHGNRAASSKSGAADVLEALGVCLSLPRPALEHALRTYNFCFLMAPRHHQAMKHVAAVRKKLGFRTIFNLLGPLANPAGTRRQLIGVFDRKWCIPMAETLKNLGTEKAWVVYGSDGIDEITTTGATYAAILENGKITERTFLPEDFSLSTAKPEDLKGGDAQTNAKALRALLNGTPGPYRDIVLANTAAVLMIHGTNAGLHEAVEKAAHAIDSGAARSVLENYAAFSQENGEAA